uniref:Uncharacterized protein n=1 Tax=Panagrellus redivivus TaxID=6233 RepID=A0A7E4W9Q8_PANRE
MASLGTFHKGVLSLALTWEQTEETCLVEGSGIVDTFHRSSDSHLHLGSHAAYSSRPQPPSSIAVPTDTDEQLQNV